MELSKLEPVVLYDNRCGACSAFARSLDRVSRSRFSMIGHYTDTGEELRKMIGGDATEMFWVVSDGYAYGGRAGLASLLRLMLRARTHKRDSHTIDAECSETCGTARAVMFRSCTLLTRSRTVRLAPYV